MNQLTTLAALPIGAGCLSRLNAEVWMRTAVVGGWELDWARDCLVNRRTGQRVSGIELVQCPEKWAHAVAEAWASYRKEQP